MYIKEVTKSVNHPWEVVIKVIKELRNGIPISNKTTKVHINDTEYKLIAKIPYIPLSGFPSEITLLNNIEIDYDNECYYEFVENIEYQKYIRIIVTSCWFSVPENPNVTLCSIIVRCIPYMYIPSIVINHISSEYTNGFNRFISRINKSI